MPRKDSAMLAEIKSWGRDPENKMKKRQRPKWNPTSRADVVKDRKTKLENETKTAKVITHDSLSELGRLSQSDSTFNMEECRKFLNSVDKTAANSRLYREFDSRNPSQVSTTPYWQRWMVCTPPENVDRKSSTCAKMFL